MMIVDTTNDTSVFTTDNLDQPPNEKLRDVASQSLRPIEDAESNASKIHHGVEASSSTLQPL